MCAIGTNKCTKCQFTSQITNANYKRKCCNHSIPDSTKVTDNLDVHDCILFQYSQSQYSVEAVIYITGFVSLKLGKKLTCEDCVSALYGDKADFFNTLIHYKSKGCLMYPSADVVSICKISEKIIRAEQNKNKCKLNNSQICLRVLHYFLKREILSNMPLHDLTPLESHRVCQAYIQLRIHFICKELSNNVEKIRNL